MNKTKEENVEQAKKELRLQGGFVDEPESKFKLIAERRLTKVWNVAKAFMLIAIAMMVLNFQERQIRKYGIVIIILALLGVTLFLSAELFWTVYYIRKNGTAVRGTVYVIEETGSGRVQPWFLFYIDNKTHLCGGIPSAKSTKKEKMFGEQYTIWYAAGVHDMVVYGSWWNALSDLIPVLLADIILIVITTCVWRLY
jgi:hypothetical protein